MVQEQELPLAEDGVTHVAFELIAAAGEARTLAFRSLKAAKERQFDHADDLMEQSKQAALKAHHMQTLLLSREASGDHLPIDVLLVHAQDHLMTAMLAQELIAEIIDVRKELNGTPFGEV